MMPKTVRDFHLMVDGRSYVGLIQNFEAPKIQKKTEEILNGGMGGAVEIDMHFEKMECSWTANEHNAKMIALFGITDQQGVMLRVNLAAEACGPGTSTEPVTYIVRGIVKEMDDGSAELGKKTEIKYTMALSYYKKIVNNVPVLEIDFINYVYRVNGIDQYAARRAALGI